LIQSFDLECVFKVTYSPATKYGQSLRASTRRITINVLWIRNCKHVLSGLAGGQQTLHMQQRATGGCYGRHLESTMSHKNLTLSFMHIYFKNNPAKIHRDPIWSNGASGFFEQCCTTTRI